MGKKIAVIHTSLAIRERLDAEIMRQIPEAEIHNIIDEKILSDVMKKGVDEDICRRISLYILAGESMGADIILNACSSVGEAFGIGTHLTKTPCLKIDQAMAEEAVRCGSSIAVYGTVATTLEPSARLIETEAGKIGKKVSVTRYLIDGAFQILAEEKNAQKHNQMVMKKIMETKDRHEVIVLAQASMAVLIPEMKNVTQPVLYSINSGVKRLKKMLEQAAS